MSFIRQALERLEAGMARLSREREAFVANGASSHDGLELPTLPFASTVDTVEWDRSLRSKKEKGKKLRAAMVINSFLYPISVINLLLFVKAPGTLAHSG